MSNNVRKGLLIIVFGVFILPILLSCIVSVPENKYAVIKRFGDIAVVYNTAGLRFKIPMIDVVEMIPKSMQIYKLDPSDVITSDKKAMIVSSYTMWRITDPRMFLKTAVSMTEATNRLDINIYNPTKNLISAMTRDESVLERGSGLDERITKMAHDQITMYGMDIIDVKIKQFDLPADNKQAVYDRMISERNQIAAQYEAEGREEATIIRNTADRERTLLLSEADATAEKLVAEGESQYMRILAEAYSGERADFYEFIRSADALKLAMKGQKTVILPLDSPLMRWFIEP
jgi:membrane protease subunit HflC